MSAPRSRVARGAKALIGIAVVVFAQFFAQPGAAYPGNDDGFLLGGEAAMTAGAVTAITTGGGAIWYNPAGLGGNTHSKIDFSASAFALSVRRMPNLLVTQLETERLTGGADDLERRSIATTLAYVRDLSKTVSAGLGVFVPESDAFSTSSSLSTRTHFREFPGIPTDFQQRVEISWKRSTYYIGPAIGWEIVPNLRVGAALFGTFRFDSERFMSLVEGHTADTYEIQRASLRQREANQTTVGARLAVGLQWQPHERLSIGVMVRTPEVLFYTWGNRSTLSDISPGLIEGEPGGLRFEDRSLDGGSADMVAPWRFHLAVAYRFSNGWIAIEADIQTPLENENLAIDRGVTWNLRAGTHFSVSERLSFGMGVFTDQIGGRNLDQLGSWNVNFYGICLGGALQYPMRLREGSERDRLIFATSLSLRYALGLGESAGNYLEVHGADNIGFQSHRQDVTFHEVTLYWGSGLIF